MRLKLSGPDYKDHDPVIALADFKKRVTLYEKSYMPLGEYEESNDMPYIQVSLSQTLSDCFPPLIFHICPSDEASMSHVPDVFHVAKLMFT